jgi:DNA-binding winged helix-turn-helix (wHTH) protein
MKTCPTCGHVLPERRNGVSLTPLKAHIFDLIRQSGETGISNKSINAIVFDGRASSETIRSHIWQINESLLDSGVRIAATIPRYGYRLKQRTENGK